MLLINEISRLHINMLDLNEDVNKRRSKLLFFLILCFEVGCLYELLRFLISPAYVSFSPVSPVCDFTSVFVIVFFFQLCPCCNKVVNLGRGLISRTDVTERPKQLKPDEV